MRMRAKAHHGERAKQMATIKSAQPMPGIMH